MEQLCNIMRQLRDPESGCAWDIKQDFKSIAAYTLEEAYEVVDAIERGDVDDLKDELGDLLLQVVFHSQMASEQNLFNFDDVAQAISDKMVRRHPHVFGDAVFDTEAQLKASWESIKAEERRQKLLRKARANSALSSAAPFSAEKPGAHSGLDAPSLPMAEGAHTPLSNNPAINSPDILAESPPITSALDGIASNLPALKSADKIQKRAARVGFDWPDISPVWSKLDEEIAEVHDAIDNHDTSAVADEIGDLLFTAVNLARHAGVDAESALRQANAKFEKRFRRVEAYAHSDGKRLSDMELAGLDALWNRAKNSS